MGRPYKCPYCGDTRSIWKGYRERKRERVRLRRCAGCGRKFTSRRIEPLRVPEVTEDETVYETADDNKPL